jgi:hypothetical protein
MSDRRDDATHANELPNPSTFESMAKHLMYRWIVERDTWASEAEIRLARAYLEERGIITTDLPDGRYSVQGETAATLEAAGVILLSLRHFVEARRRVAGLQRRPGGF